jgi:signal transduction histidine kinase/ligand-binding sensor domain-containing protein
VFDTTHGLAHDRVGRIVSDSRGFLWFATAAGLSRFDGERFRTYGLRDGLPSAAVTDIVEAGDGTYWVGTEVGVAVLQPERKPLFEPMAWEGDPRTRFVRALHRDRSGALWIATDAGVWRRDGPGRAPVRLPVADGGTAFHFAEDEHALWIATARGVLRRAPDGSVSHHDVRPGPATDVVIRLHIDRSGRLWAAHETGVATLDTPDPVAAGGARWRWHTDDLGRPLTQVRTFAEAPDGRLLVGRVGDGLLVIGPDAKRRYGLAHGFSDETINDLAHDTAGNLWIATDLGGAVRVARDGFESFGPEDGLGHDWVQWLFEDEAGTLYAVSGPLMLNRWDGRRFHGSQRPEVRRRPGLHTYHRALRHKSGEWWQPTAEGLLRFDAPKRIEDLEEARPRGVYTRRQGVAGDWPRLVIEDARGDVWIAFRDVPLGTVTQWDRARDRFHAVETRPPDNPAVATALAASATGDLWVGFDDGRLARVRDGRPTLVPPLEAAGRIWAITPGGAGRLWVAHARGLAVVEGDPPRMRAFSEHLAETPARCVLPQGESLFVGTTRGLELLGADGRRIRRFTRIDGLPNDEVFSAYRDRAGRLWFGTLAGLARLHAPPAPPPPPPPTLIDGVRASGRPLPVSELGRGSIEGLTFQAGESRVDLDFFACSAHVGEPLLFQHLLREGDDWSPPQPERHLTLAGLAPGAYRIKVRAVRAYGQAAGPPAVLAFRILAPAWRRPWFLAVGGAALAGAAWLLHRRRLRRAMEIERIRTRIASDLHDDIGANLSQIAVLSEVARQRADGAGVPLAEPLGQIADTARSSVDSMSDIVWAVDPSRDSLRDLAQRMRQMAGDLCAARQVALAFEAPDANVPLGADERRELFLFFKEALTNALEHSGCRRLRAVLALEPTRLLMRLADDGRGMPAEPPETGHGLRNMRRRAERLGADLAIEAREGEGTTVSLSIPRRSLGRGLAAERA